MQIVALLPVLDDWTSAREVIRQLGTDFAATPHRLSVLLVDDGSHESAPAGLDAGLLPVAVLRLKRNLGNQRALAVGMCQIAEQLPCDAVLVMDSDGQDEPADAVRLVARLLEEQAALQPGPIIFAERTVRSESLLFRAGYLSYRVLHYVLTGRGIRIGNFSVIPRARLAALVSDPNLWSHYAASVVSRGVPYRVIPTRRGHRIEGKSRLGFIGHVKHGLSALDCYYRITRRRLFYLSSFFLGSFLVLSLLLAWHTPEWQIGRPWLLLLLALLMLLLGASVVVSFTLNIVRARHQPPFVPIRDYAALIER